MPKRLFTYLALIVFLSLLVVTHFYLSNIPSSFFTQFIYSFYPYPNMNIFEAENIYGINNYKYLYWGLSILIISVVTLGIIKRKNKVITIVNILIVAVGLVVCLQIFGHLKELGRFIGPFYKMTFNQKRNYVSENLYALSKIYAEQIGQERPEVLFLTEDEIMRSEWEYLYLRYALYPIDIFSGNHKDEKYIILFQKKNAQDFLNQNEILLKINNSNYLLKKKL